LPRNKTTGWDIVELHSTSEAIEAGVNPAPERVMVSPPARPVHVGAAGLELSHVTPADVDDKFNVGEAADAVAAVPSSAPPAISATTPAAANVEASLVRPTVSSVPCPVLGAEAPYGSGAASAPLPRGYCKVVVNAATTPCSC
jgi:hypothetical protein